MRILLATLGSAGDTHPYVAIGEELVRRGHAVAMLANPHFEGRIRSVGMDFLPLGEEADFLSVLHDPRLARQGESPYLVIEALFNKSIEPSYRAMQEAIATWKPDAVVRHHIMFAARWAAEPHRIPVLTGVLTPSMWFHPDEPMVLRSFLPFWVMRRLGPLVRGASRMALRWFIDRPANQARRAMGLASERDVFFTETAAGLRVLGLWSRYFRPSMPGDPPSSDVVGYCFFDRARGDADKALDPSLERFLRGCEDRNNLPVAFTLGTTIVHHARDFFATAVRAAREAGRPAILLVGKGEKGPPIAEGSDVCVCEYAPHSLLMPRVAASIHHAGAGSSAQALRSGRPSVAIPFVNDEFDIAFRLERLGVAVNLPAPKLRSRRAVGNLAEALHQVTSGPGFPERAREIGERMKSEYGAGRAADEVEKFAVCSARPPNPLCEN
ncbi:MAG: glycosyltransferase family 1 protein [Planctomycetes bacterium]|nr:glycosyltransferase family 1 protein [Planctomycetota bacterium]